MMFPVMLGPEGYLGLWTLMSYNQIILTMGKDFLPKLNQRNMHDGQLFVDKTAVGSGQNSNLSCTLIHIQTHELRITEKSLKPKNIICI